MGNQVALLIPNRRNWRLYPAKEEKTLKIVKTDGKVLRYSTPLLVGDLLSKFDGHGVGVSRKADIHLPNNYELRTGHVYHLLPLHARVDGSAHAASGRKRIKIVVTKQQLHAFLSSKTATLEDMLKGIQKKGSGNLAPLNGWRPQLETIFEGN